MHHIFYEKDVWKNHGIWPYARKQIHFFVFLKFFVIIIVVKKKKKKIFFLSIFIFYFFWAGLGFQPSWAGSPTVLGCGGLDPAQPSWLGWAHPLQAWALGQPPLGRPI